MTEARIHRCTGCHRYTLKERCPECGGEVRTPHPARFSPEDRWGKYRRALMDAQSGRS